MYLSNKELVKLLYKEVIGKANLEIANQIVAEDYIQHNPMIPSGRAGVLAAIAYLKQMPKETPIESPIKRMIAEDEYVVVHLNVTIAGQDQLVMDIFRLANGQLVEHWDAIESVSANAVSARIEGECEIRDLDQTEANKAVIAALCQFLCENTEYIRTHRIIGEGNFVLAQSSGKLAEDVYVFYDLYCLQNGEIVNQWLVKQAIPAQMAHDNGMI